MGVDLKTSYDAVVVGGRCAGGATAMLLARGGLDVLLVDQGARGADALSTLALMRAGVLQLSRWGLLEAVRASGTPPVRTTTFHYDGAPVEIRIKPRDGVDALFAPRRTLLDPLLADAAAAAGADVRYRTRLTGLLTDGGRVTGVRLEQHGAPVDVRAGIVIGADGLHSTVARLVGAQPYRTGPHAAAVIYGLWRDVRVEGYHWHYRPGVSVGAIPTAGHTLVFVSVPRDRFMRDLRFDLAAAYHAELRRGAPELAAAVSQSSLEGTYRGFAGHPGLIRPAWGPGWALAGDAGYFKDPLTAHGISDALRDAELLARAVLERTDSALANYQSVRDALSLRLFDITDRIASYDWDMPSLQALHKALSDEMAREVLHMRKEMEACPV